MEEIVVTAAEEALDPKYKDATRLTDLSTMMVRGYTRRYKDSSAMVGEITPGEVKAFLTAKAADGKLFLIEVSPELYTAVGKALLREMNGRGGA